ncbi:MAG TPA: hypothetical protein VG308_11320 [Stellaceae bacterium]|jgi:hypothetical protein|nr:hypothetical protein [Stellaceae bacterium]
MRIDVALRRHGYLPPFGALGELAPSGGALIRVLFAAGNCFANKVTEKIQNCLFRSQVYISVTRRYIAVTEIACEQIGRVRCGRLTSHRFIHSGNSDHPQAATRGYYAARGEPGSGGAQIDQICLAIAPENLPARRLYEKLGFVDRADRLPGIVVPAAY